MEVNKFIINERDNENLKCGFWRIRCGLIEKLASKKLFVLNFGLIGCLCIATSIYFNATITTMEKRFEMPTRNSGIISMGFDLSSLLMTPILCHYLRRKHRPRWIAVSGMTMSIYCFSVAVLHIIYGPGDYALSNTQEYGYSRRVNTSSEATVTSSFLCSLTKFTDCTHSLGNLAPQIYLFVAQLIAGILGTLYDSLGIAYIDDNIVKSKIPLYISFTQFLKLFGAFVGYTLAAQSLKYYIAPQLTPTIDITDSKWIGAWWLGWAVLGVFFAIVSFLIQCFPVMLPRAVLRQQTAVVTEKFQAVDYAELKKESNLMANYKLFFSNTTLIFNVLSNVLYCMAYVPLWGFITKYIEIQYKQTASTASLLSGPIPTACIAIGVLVSGISFNRIKPKARNMALWNIVVGIFSIVSIVSYNYLGCVDIDASTMQSVSVLERTQSIFNQCNCDYVKYSPICGDDGITYISPCHAGCSTDVIIANGTQIYENCNCVETEDKIATPGSCAINACQTQLLIFVTVLCIDRFITASGRVSNFMLTLRLIKPDQKEFSLGMITTMTAILAHIPGPILFGWIYDQNCLVWGKTCTGKGNCWLYDTIELRFWLSVSSAGLLVIGTFFDCCVWARVKNLVVFDQEINTITNSNCISK